MSSIFIPAIIKALIEPLRHTLKDSDPYVRKTAAICVAKLYAFDKRLVDKEGFVNDLRDLLADSNPTVIANAVAALIEISERSDNIQLRLNMTIASKLVNAMAECSECVIAASNWLELIHDVAVVQMGTDLYSRIAHVLRTGRNDRRRNHGRTHLNPSATCQFCCCPHYHQSHPLPSQLYGRCESY